MKENLKYEKLGENMTAAQDKSGLILTSDACLLSAFVSKNAKNRICELGAGSGVISLLLLMNHKIRSSLCVDFQPHMCDIANENAKNNGLTDVMQAVCADVNGFTSDIKFDVVVSNPPYFKSGDGKPNVTESDRLCRHESTAGIDGFASCAARILKDGGTAFFCYTPSRSADLYHAFKNAGLEPKTEITVYPAKDKRPSLILVSAKKGAKSGLLTYRPLFIYKDAAGGELSDDYIKIKESMSTDILK